MPSMSVGVDYLGLGELRGIRSSEWDDSLQCCPVYREVSQLSIQPIFKLLSLQLPEVLRREYKTACLSVSSTVHHLQDQGPPFILDIDLL